MKKLFLVFLLTPFLLSTFILNGQNTGIGTATPGNTLHVFKGSAGIVSGFADAPLIVENSTQCFINILAPDAVQKGVLFGSPSSNVSGGLIYNNIFNPNGLQFRTNGNVTRMVLTDNGNLGVGTVSPGAYKLKISHFNIEDGLAIENANSGDLWEFYNGSYLYMYFNNESRGSFHPTTGVYTSLSDERLKTNIKPMSSMLEKIKQLNPSVYQFKNSADKQEYNGFIAQDVMKLFPSLVVHNVNPVRKVDVYTMDYSGFGVIAIKGIQEQQSLIETLQKQVEAAKDEIPLQIGKQQAIIEEQNKKIELLLKEIQKVKEQLNIVINRSK
jgi:trimeric autotransporter adhesin